MSIIRVAQHPSSPFVVDALLIATSNNSLLYTLKYISY